jgi:hypothetical protein
VIRLTTSLIYAAAMAATGLALGVASLSLPMIHDGPVPPLMTLIGVSFVFDLALMGAASRGWTDVLQMNGRITGFFAGALIYLGTRLALA